LSVTYRDLLASRLPTGFPVRLRVSLMALGLGATEAAFIFTARLGLRRGSAVIFLGLSGLALLRFVFQDRIAILETRAMREIVSGLRQRLLGVLRTHAVPIYRPEFKRDLTRTLEETAPRVGEGFLARERCVASALQGLILIPCLFLLSWRLALLSLFLIAPAWLAVRWRSRTLRALERSETLGRAQGKQVLADFGDGLEASFGTMGNAEKGFELSLLSLNTDLEKTQTPEWHWRLAQARYPALLETGFFFALAGLILIGGASLGSLESWILFSGLLLLAYRPVREAARYYPISLQGTQALRDANRLLESWASLPKRVPPRRHASNALALENVSFGYGAGPSVFRNFSAEFPADAITGITGPNGAGKTTLLRLLAGAEIPLQGAVLWSENLYSPGFPGSSQPGGISYLPQRIAPGSTWAHWAKSLRTENADLWEELSDLLGLNPFLKSVHPEAFSGGERQRMALAQALSSRSLFLMMDEPTTALPGDTRQQILEKALALWTRPFGPQGFRRGALIVSHEPFLAAACDQMFALNGEEHAFRSEPKPVQP
jgi:ABC-type multidrug transport system fused ATPase/permease subunit